MADTNIINNVEVNNEICKDPETKREKAIVMCEQRANALFFSISDTFKFVAALMVSSGMAIIGMALKDASGSVGLKSIGGVLGIIGDQPVALAFLGAAAVATAVAVGAHYVAAHHFHSASFDQSELNAKHTAKYLVKEIEKEHAGVATEHDQNRRADGKTWAQVVAAQHHPVSQRIH